MSWASIASNQCISLDNLQNAVTTGVFTALTTIPSGSKQITKTEASTYVNINTSYTPFVALASNQLPVKSDLVAASGTSADVSWSISRAVGGGSATLEIQSAGGAVLLNVTSTASPQTGTLTISAANLPYLVIVSVTGVAGANYIICNISAGGTIYSASVPDGGSDSYLVNPTPIQSSVNVVYGGTPPSCGI